VPPATPGRERPRLVTGSGTNLKVTYPEDLVLAAAILAAERRGLGDSRQL
jgi:2-C-methyl-D-erythritol 4-phosphate cytidylyltransferase